MMTFEQIAEAAARKVLADNADVVGIVEPNESAVYELPYELGLFELVKAAIEVDRAQRPGGGDHEG